MNWNESLKPFVRRVRIARAWKCAAIGLTAGGAAALIWTVLDIAVRWYTEWPLLLSVAGGGAFFGALVGLVWKLTPAQVAASVDRRAHLKDRIATALENQPNSSLFLEAQADDAQNSLSRVRPRDVYPLKVGRWHLSGVAFTIASVGLFAVMSSDILLKPDQKKAKADAAKVAEAIERIAKPLEEKKPADGAAARAQERLAKEMRELARDLKKARLTKEEALQKANELAKEAKKFGEDRVSKAEQTMVTARDQLTKMELEKQGIDPATLEKLSLDTEQQQLLEQMMQKQGAGQGKKGKFDQNALNQIGLSQLSADMMNLSDKESQDMQSELAKEISELERKAANGSLSESEKKRLDQMKKLMDSLKLSDAAKKGLEELMKSDVMKELQELVSKMDQAQQKAKSGEPLTEKELDQMKKNLDELAKKMEDPKAREEIKKQLEQMLQDLKDGKLTLGQCQKCMGLLGLSMPNMPGAGGAGSQFAFPDTGEINKSDGLKTSGDGLPLAVRGERDEKRGSESYIEIKSPTAPGGRSNVPYNKVLPKYTDRAEADLGRQKVPKKHEDRVKKYFDSLNGEGQ